VPTPIDFGRQLERCGNLAPVMASTKVSPKGIGSGIRMIKYFINRREENLSATRQKKLEKAKHLLQHKRKSSK
jgi:hypothetical protein